MREGLSALKQGKDLPVTYRPSMPQAPALTSGNVVDIRVSFGLTQAEFSKLVMVSPKTIQSWEQGTRRPSGTALRILQLLQSPDALEPIMRYRATKASRKTNPRARS